MSLVVSHGYTIAQPNFNLPNPNQEQQSNSHVLYVNPVNGNDYHGNGTLVAPLRSINQALQLVQANTVIVLAPGIYSAQTGERFPLQLPSGVTVQGDPRTKGRNIVISGGGTLVTSARTQENITLTVTQTTRLTGVTVTNPYPQGYGLWIEKGSPAIADNTFANNIGGGIVLTGNSNAKISGNYFYNNPGSGIIITGNSQSEITSNFFTRTGFGINITENAQPQLISNQFTDNQIGVLVTENAQPILRHNIIANSRESGVVAMGQSLPDLGTTVQPGANKFQGNRRFDIHNATLEQTIAAAGNQFSGRVAGKLDLLANASTRQSPQRNSTSLTPISSQPPNLVERNRPNTAINTASPALPSSSQKQPSQATTTPPPSINVPVTPTPPPRNLPPARTPTANPGERLLAALLVVKPGSVPNFARLASSSLRDLAPAPYRPPTVNIPSTSNTNTTPPASGRYRVIVATNNSRQEAILKEIVPGAFRTVYNGQTVMQAGIFSSRANAQKIVQALISRGLRATILPL